MTSRARKDERQVTSVGKAIGNRIKRLVKGDASVLVERKPPGDTGPKGIRTIFTPKKSGIEKAKANVPIAATAGAQIIGGRKRYLEREIEKASK